MAIKFDFALRSAFVLRPEAIRRIWDILDSGIGSVSATARCADNSRREFSTVSALLEFDNARAREILSLEISARSKDWKRSGDVTFRAWSDPISVTLKLDDEGDVPRTRDDLRHVLDGTKAWYSGISRIDLGYVLMGCLAILWLVSSIAVGDRLGARASVPIGRAVVLALELVLVISGIGVVCWLVHRLHRRYFPRAMFAIGQGTDRFDVDDKMRWAVIIGAVVSVFGSLVAAIATGWIGA
jgi:hypothetical protein